MGKWPNPTGAKGRQGYVIHVSTNAINQALKSIVERVDKVAQEALVEIAEEGCAYAESLYRDAAYDGEHDAKVFVSKEGPRTVDVTAVGNSVNFIEYGTGVWGSGKKNWYFSAKGRDIKLTATGEPASYVRGGYDKIKYYYEDDKGRKRHISEFGYDYSAREYGEIEYDEAGPSAISFIRGDAIGYKNKNSDQLPTKKRYTIEAEREHVPR